MHGHDRRPRRTDRGRPGERTGRATGPRTSAPAPVTLGGASGYYLEVLVPTNLDESTCVDEVQLYRTGATTMAWEQGYLAHWWILDVHGVRVVVMNICDVSCSPKNLRTLTTMAESITFTTSS